MQPQGVLLTAVKKEMKLTIFVFLMKYPTEIVILLFQMFLIHYLTFEPTLPPTDALISLDSCWSLLFSLYLDMKISLVHGFQIYRMSENTRTICPVVLYPLHSHNILQSALAWVSTRS